MSACSLGVHVGSNMDPPDAYGIAHFTEHLLFLGTAKYQNPDTYSDYVTHNGGIKNAMTLANMTLYGYKIANSAFEKSLDMFAEFFVSPLFTKEWVNKEVDAVNSEN